MFGNSGFGNTAGGFGQQQNTNTAFGQPQQQQKSQQQNAFGKYS